jgi:hypothetical protein
LLDHDPHKHRYDEPRIGVIPSRTKEYVPNRLTREEFSLGEPTATRKDESETSLPSLEHHLVGLKPRFVRRPLDLVDLYQPPCAIQRSP